MKGKKVLTTDEHGLTQMKKEGKKLPEGWEWKKLIDCCEKKDQIVSGPFGSNLKVSDYKKTGVPIIRLQNIGDGYFIEKDIKCVSREKAEELKYHSYRPGDLVLAKLGIPIGKTCFIPNSFSSGIIVADVVRIRPNKTDILYSFLKYYLNSDLSASQLTGNITGSTRPRVNLNHVREIQIPLPPLAEQERIVAILDEAFAAIDKAKANAEKNMANAKELFESYLNKVFSNPGEDWEEFELNKYVIFIDYRGRTPKKTKSGIRLITAKNIKKGYIQREPEEYIAVDNYDSWMTRGIPEKGDILFTTEAPLANVAQLDTNEKVAFAQRTIIFQPDPKALNKDFLKYLLLSKPIQEKIKAKGTGATVKGIKSRLLKKIKIAFPGIKQQKRIVNQLDKISSEAKHLESIYQQKIIALEELKKSILKKAFEGEL
jgi:type I restriction enzyme S subunit